MRLGMKGLNVPYYYNYHIKFNDIYNDTFDPEYLTQEFREKLVSQLRTSSSVSDAVYIRKANLHIVVDESNLTDVGKLAVGNILWMVRCIIAIKFILWKILSMRSI